MSLEDFIVVPVERSFTAALGLEFLDPTHARVPVTAGLHGAHGAVHSGVYAAIAESIASTGTAVEMVPQGFMVSGLSNATYVLAQVSAGVLEAEAYLHARSDGEWLWNVDMRAGETLAASAVVVIAVRRASRPARP
jgi:1,4-dihydroxy-2-naphthoyl-CoA hydrolase